jgi:cell wall-associated NlpC family hydrolase
MRLRAIAAVALAGVFATAAQLMPSSSPAAARARAAQPSSAEAAASTLLDPAVLVLVTAAKATGTLKAIEGSLIYLGGKYESATATQEAAAAPLRESKAPPEEEGVDGGAALPPASAGTNGTPRPPLPQGVGGSIVARAPSPSHPGAASATATYVSGIALAPPSAPERIAGTINAANTIVGQPYVWGGGHGSWYSRGYDCSGAVSFALAGGGFLSSPLTSGALESWGAPGPGRWLTVYASPSHAYAVIAGLRWDTVGDASGSGPRWHLAGAVPDGFVARHPPGY